MIYVNPLSFLTQWASPSNPSNPSVEESVVEVPKKILGEIWPAGIGLETYTQINPTQQILGYSHF